MEAPPLSTAPPLPAAVATTALYPPSTDSSPRSRQTDSWDADAPPFRPPPKLRLMCSYGGHIVPRPHDKTLCYVGGDTRIIVVDRHTSLSELHHRLSRNLLHNQAFSLKYQLPSEDLDSLISISTEEDLENMVEEHDRLSNAAAGGAAKTGRLRLFLFPKSTSSIDQLLIETASTKSEDWFFNALNGKASTISSDRGFSETSSINNLLGLDDDFAAKVEKDGETQMQGLKIGANGNVNANNNVVNHEANSIPDSPMPDTTSSFGSTSSSPSVANLPPIKVRVEENPKMAGLGIEEQFQQMTVGFVGNVNLPPPQKQEDGGGPTAAAPVVVGGEYPNRVFSDDERSDHGGYRKVQQFQQQVQPPLQTQQIPQFQQKQTTAFDLPSPDSVSSEGSMRQPKYQEPIIQIHSGNNSSKNQMQPQIQSNQYDQSHQPQQFLHPNNHNHYIPIPVASYLPVYPPQQQQPVRDHQYPLYYIPSKQNQAYTNQQINGPQLIQVPSSPYLGFTQIHHPSQSMPPQSSAGNANYTYEFADPAHQQMYYRPLQQ